MISLATTLINDKVKKNVNLCLEEGMIGGGKFVKEFEDKTTKYLDVKHCIAVSSGSMADIVALAALKTKYPNKTEVIVPALTFVAQINSVIINGLKPVFADVGYDYQISRQREKIKVTDKTLCIMPANLMGKKCNIEYLSKQGVPVLEDSCEAFGIKPHYIGTYSFYPSHTITTGEGGMIATNDSEIAELCRSIRNHGREGEGILNKFNYTTFGFNGKMSNLLAAIGSAVIDSADKVIGLRKENVQLLNVLLDKNFYAESPHGYPILCDNRDEVLLSLEKKGIEARKLFSAVKGYPVAEDIAKRGLFLPIHQDLTYEQIKEISNCLRLLCTTSPRTRRVPQEG